jgi:opacity protein-like surface antigen
MLKETILALAIIVFSANLAIGQTETEERVGFRGWGPRVGASIDPDQIVFGGHVDFGNFAKRVRFQPSLEMGLGDNLTLVTVNFDADYRFRSKWDVWTPYVGGGVALHFYSWDNGANDSENDTEVGLHALGGIEKGLSNGDRFFLVVKVGFVHSPDLKILAGWTFFH